MAEKVELPVFVLNPAEAVQPQLVSSAFLPPLPLELGKLGTGN